MPAKKPPGAADTAPDLSSLCHSLLDDALIRYRTVRDGTLVQASLPALFAAMVADEVRDFPALRPHQRHPWHAFLTQLAALALHKAGDTDPWTDAASWRDALLALTPADPDGAAWCLVSPPDRPALLQAPVPGGRIDDWKSVCRTPDELDMLVTSRNHDLKGSRALSATPDAWLFALLSLQTQEGFLGAGNYGISRMNGGFASRPGIGMSPVAAWGRRWRHDLARLLAHHDRIAQQNGLRTADGLALLWLTPWDGTDSLAFTALDPFYIEICRRVRLTRTAGSTSGLQAVGTGTKAARVAAKELNGRTGDAWTPIETGAGKALTITDDGFGYRLVTELLFGARYSPAAAQEIPTAEGDTRFEWLARGVTRGQGKTEGFHERRVPMSPKVRRLLAGGQRDRIAQLAAHRIETVGEVRKLLWKSLMLLLCNGKMPGDPPKNIKQQCDVFSKPFERSEDTRFFDDLMLEIEADGDMTATAARLTWQQGLVDRAESFLQRAFEAGPRSAMQRYHAQSTALSYFHGGLRGPKSPVGELADHWRQQAAERAARRDAAGMTSHEKPTPQEDLPHELA